MARTVEEMVDSLARLLAQQDEVKREARSLRASIGFTRKHLRARGLSDARIDELVAEVDLSVPEPPGAEEIDWPGLRAEHMARRVPVLVAELYGEGSTDPSAVPTAESVAVAEWHEMFGSAGLPPIDDACDVDVATPDFRDLGLG